MKRLLNSLAGAASDLSDYAADRVDDWAAGLRGEDTDTPEQPDEFDDDPEGWRDRAAIAEATLESTRESRDAAYVALEHIEHLADLVTNGHDLANMGSDPNTALGKMHAAIVRDRKRAADRIATLEQQLAAHHEHEAHVEDVDARAMHVVKVALDMYGKGQDPMTLTLRHPLDLGGRVAEALNAGLRDRAALDAIEHMTNHINNGLELDDRHKAPPNTVARKLYVAVQVDRARAAEHIATLEQQLAAHHEYEQVMREQVEAIGHAIAFIEEAEDDADGTQSLAERVHAAMTAVKRQRDEARSELHGMHERERQVDKVIAAWDVKRGNLKGYDRLGVIDPETPAGRVVELLRELCSVRPRTTESITATRAALDAITAALRSYGLDINGDGDYAANVVEGVRGALHAIETAADDAAARIRAAAAAELATVQSTPGNDTGDEFNAYLAGMEAAARIAADEATEADPGVAHVDTVNGRQRPAQAAETTGERHVDLAVTRDTEELE